MSKSWSVTVSEGGSWVGTDEVVTLPSGQEVHDQQGYFLTPTDAIPDDVPEWVRDIVERGRASGADDTTG